MKKTIWWLTVLSLLVAITTAVFVYYQTNLITFYNDTTSHLNIARRIVDNLHPGLVQIGSTWLPLLHVLQLPFIWNDFMWQSGLAGTLVVSSIFFLSGIFLYKTLILLTKKPLVGLIGVLALIGNANVMYMQSTPMFEPLFISISIITFYFFIKWIIEQNLLDLILSAFFIALLSLTRYEGWFYFVGMSLVVLVYSLYKNGKKKAEGKFLLFSTLGALGILIWLLYNLVIFGNPTYFAKNEYSAYTQQLEYEMRGDLPTKGNIILSTANYLLAIKHNLGLPISLIFLVSGVGLFLILIHQRKWGIIMGILILYTPLFFHIFALFKGHTILIVPELPPYGIEAKGIWNGIRVPFFNIRYGLLMLPAAIITTTLFCSKNKMLLWLFGLVIIIQTANFYYNFKTNNFDTNFVVLKDIIGSRKHIPSIAKDTEYFKDIYDGGLILASSAGTDIELFEIGIPLKNYITEGTGKYWGESIKDPSRYAKWIIMTETDDDRVGRLVRSTEGFSKFTRIYSGGDFSIYKKGV